MKTNKKPTNRNKMMEILGKRLKFVRPSEDFSLSSGSGSIWVSAENGEDMNGWPIFDYYAEGRRYVFGVLDDFEAFVNKHHWYCEWYDAGTIMIHRICCETE